MKGELDLSNYATKTDFKNPKAVETLKFAKKTDLASLKSNVDKLDINKFKNVPTNLSNLKKKIDKLGDYKLVSVSVDLSKLSDVVNNDVVKEDVYNSKIKHIEDKIPDITNVATATSLNAKINKIKDEIHSIKLATTTVLTAVENEIPNASNLVKKITITKINEIENKITPDHGHD